MLTDHDKISLITSIYQSGANVTQFLNDLKLLSSALDGKSTQTVDHSTNETSQAGFDSKTQTIINTWKTVLTATDPDSPNPSLLKFQEEFLTENLYVPNSKPTHKFYLTARSVGITSAFVIHAARTMIQQPHLKIWYIAESNEAIGSFFNGIATLLPNDLIDHKDHKAVKLSNGSSINFITQPTIATSFKETTGTISQQVAQYLNRWGTPDVLLIDDIESFSYNIVPSMFGLVKSCPNVIMAGGTSNTQGIPYLIMSGPNNLWIEKKIIPWYEGSSSDQDFIKSCLTEEQYMESQLCQFPRKPKEIIVESQATKAYNDLVNILFKPTMIDGKPDMILNTNYVSSDEFTSKMDYFKNKYLTPWMFKIGEINDNSEVEIVEEINKNTGRKEFKINVGNISPERAAEILEKVKSDIQNQTNVNK